eukprot:TRINITY_DN13647_c4_g1_i1.p1 TRINITY_DN13647_c4_g1~~TRINITY_DN13647_c4_g1_i1.p1  ORF type:complete len:497 (+),score=63.30 TRINITY_DN13647_c4_g1_i1:184-1674(+)
MTGFEKCWLTSTSVGSVRSVITAWRSLGSFSASRFSLIALSALASVNGLGDFRLSLPKTSVAADEGGSGLLNVQLQKQYVPVKDGGETFAYKTSYFGSIYVGGHPSQLFTVVFDTGSGHLILPSTACSNEVCMKLRRYNRTFSNTAVDIEYDGTPVTLETQERKKVTVAFGTGEVTGEFVHEKVCLLRGSSITRATTGSSCADLRIVVATNMSHDPFGYFAFDGVLGLGLSALTLDKTFSFFPELVMQHPGMKPQFAVFLAPYDGGPSSISFGGFDPSRAASEIKWTSVAKPELGHWQIQIKRILIGSSILEECQDGSCHAIFDTGTSLLAVPRETSRSMHRLLARTVPTKIAHQDVDCRAVPGKHIHFDFGGPVLTVREEDYSRPKPFRIPDVGNTSNGTNINGSTLFCRSLLLPVDIGPPIGPKVFIFGEPVLRRYYTVYDFVEKKIGFAQAAELPEVITGIQPIDAPPAGSRVSGAPLQRNALRGSKVIASQS